MTINWRVRFNNPIFWAQIFLAIMAPMLAYYGLNFKDLTTWGIVRTILWDSLRNPYILGLIIVNVFNTLNDPTTKGLSDSQRALTYTTPN